MVLLNIEEITENKYTDLEQDVLFRDKLFMAYSK